MKICVLTRRFALDSGGIGRVSTEIRNGLQELGHDVQSVSTDKEDLVSYFKYVFWDIRSKIPRDCDIYHAITPMESIWIPKHKSVATILDIIPITNPEMHGARMGGSKLKYTIGKQCFAIGCRVASRCAGLTSISGHTQYEYGKHFKRRPQVIRLGIREDLEPRSNDNSVLKIGYLGQVDRRKRVDLLVEAFLRCNLDAELWIAGEGTDRQRLQAMSARDRRIHFMGFIEDETLPDFYNMIDLLVFPSAIEGYGLPPVEAMACRKPVIVLRDAIIPYDVKRHCIIDVSLDDTFADIARVRRLMNLADIDGNYEFAKLHSWKECVNEYVKIYERILG